METIAGKTQILSGSLCIEEFNERHQEILESPVRWLIDECMSTYCPCKTATGGFLTLAILNKNQSQH
jgi:hypothetical protein